MNILRRLIQKAKFIMANGRPGNQSKDNRHPHGGPPGQNRPEPDPIYPDPDPGPPTEPDPIPDPVEPDPIEPDPVDPVEPDPEEPEPEEPEEPRIPDPDPDPDNELEYGQSSTVHSFTTKG